MSWPRNSEPKRMSSFVLGAQRIAEVRCAVDAVEVGIIRAEEAHGICVAAFGNVEEGFGLAAQLDVTRVHEEDLRLIEPDIGAERPRERGMLLGRIVAEQQNCRSRTGIAQGSGTVGLCRPARERS